MLQLHCILSRHLPFVKTLMPLIRTDATILLVFKRMRRVLQVKYSELVHSGVSRIELQEQLVGGEMTTITMRISKSLKEAEAARLRGVSFFVFIRSCMIDELSRKA